MAIPSHRPFCFCAICQYHQTWLDDDVVLLKNRYVQEGISGIDDIFAHGFLYGFNQRNDQSYRPIVLASYAIEKSLFGGGPMAFHLINILAYALLGCLIFILIRRMMPEISIWLPIWLALLFVFHPVSPCLIHPEHISIVSLYRSLIRR